MSPTYRFIRLDGEGRLHDAVTFAAADDANAIAKVASAHPDSRFEIWNGNRLVKSRISTDGEEEPWPEAFHVPNGPADAPNMPSAG